MPSLNRVQLIGIWDVTPRRVSPPTARNMPPSRWPSTTPGNRPQAKNRKRTDWFLVNAWGKLADICRPVPQERPAGVTSMAACKTDRWDDKGETHYRTTVVARSIQLLDRRPEEPEEVEEAAD